MWPSSAPAPVAAPVDLAAEDQAAADPGADRQHHRVFGAACGAVEVLCQSRHGRVVVDEDGQTGAPADDLADRQVLQRQVDCRHGNALVVIDRGGDAKTHRRGTRAFPTRLLDLTHEKLDQLVLGLPGRGLTALPENLRIGIENAEQHLRATQVDAD